MQAIQFNTIIDHDVIHLPKIPTAWQNKNVRVILLDNDRPSDQQGVCLETEFFIDKAINQARALLSHPVSNYRNAVRIDVSDFHFSREDANER